MLAVLAWVCAIPAGGCLRPCPQTFLTQDQLVAAYNANAAKAPRLWARAAVQVHLVDSKGGSVDWGSTLLSPNSYLLLEKETAGGALGPYDFVLIGREAAGPDVFRLGTSTRDGVYYVWTGVGGHAGGLWGRTALAGAPGAPAIPANPLDLVSVLSITPLPEDFTQPPTVLLRLSDQPRQCAYVLTLIDRQPRTGRLVARRDVYLEWADGRPARPFRVDLLDEVGRVVMTARLKDYRPIAIAGEEAPASERAVLPADIEISWPRTGSRIHIVLSEMKTKRVDPDAFLLFWEGLPSAVRENLTCVDPQASTTPSQR